MRLGGVEGVAGQHPAHGVAPAHRARRTGSSPRRTAGCRAAPRSARTESSRRRPRCRDASASSTPSVRQVPCTASTTGLRDRAAVHAPRVDAVLGHEVETGRADVGRHVGEVEAGGEVVAVGEDQPGTQLGVAVELAVGDAELLEHPPVRGVALLGAVEADEQHVPVALDGRPASLFRLHWPWRQRTCPARARVSAKFSSDRSLEARCVPAFFPSPSSLPLRPCCSAVATSRFTPQIPTVAGSDVATAVEDKLEETVGTPSRRRLRRRRRQARGHGDADLRADRSRQRARVRRGRDVHQGDRHRLRVRLQGRRLARTTRRSRRSTRRRRASRATTSPRSSSRLSRPSLPAPPEVSCPEPTVDIIVGQHHLLPVRRRDRQPRRRGDHHRVRPGRRHLRDQRDGHQLASVSQLELFLGFAASAPTILRRVGASSILLSSDTGA